MSQKISNVSNFLNTRQKGFTEKDVWIQNVRADSYRPGQLCETNHDAHIIIAIRQLHCGNFVCSFVIALRANVEKVVLHLIPVMNYR